jgi:hypothetical protein
MSQPSTPGTASTAVVSGAGLIAPATLVEPVDTVQIAGTIPAGEPILSATTIQTGTIQTGTIQTGTIQTGTIPAGETLQSLNTGPPTATILTIHTVQATDVNQTAELPKPGRTRSARLRQISVLGVFTSVAMVSARVPAVVIVPVMIVVLAGIDIVGGVVAKSWALGRSPWAFAAGAVLFVLLFWVYGMSLRHGELSTITIGWVVLVTLADMGLDRFHYDVHFPPSKWIAALGAVALLAYLLIGSNGDRDPARKTSPTTSPTGAPAAAPSGAPTGAPSGAPSTASVGPNVGSGPG